jgi:hypothetical protein
MGTLRHSAAGATALAVVLALAALAAGAPSAALARPSASGCTDPVVHDRYDGFHLGIPAGWSLAVADGFIVVHKDQIGSIESVVDPALLSNGQTPARFFQVALAALRKDVAGAGNAMTFHQTGATTASLTGRAATTGVTGQAQLTLESYPSAHGSQLAVFSAYWAPPAQLASYRSALAGIGACYGPEAGTLFRIYRDAAFTYPLPPGWKVQEGVDQLSAIDDHAASATYVFTQAISSATTGVTDVKSYVAYMLPLLGVKVDTVLATSSAPNTTTVTGATQQFEQVEFLGSNGGNLVHGIVGAQATSGGGVTSGTVRLVMATRGQWNALNQALLRVASGIQHDFTQDDQELLHVQQQLQGFAQQVEGFDQALNGTDIVENTATGQTFEAPYSAYSKSGPDGPGYYTNATGNLMKLKVLTPQ